MELIKKFLRPSFIALAICLWSSFASAIAVHGHHGETFPGTFEEGETGHFIIYLNTNCGYYIVHQTYVVKANGFIAFTLNQSGTWDDPRTTPTVETTQNVQKFSDAPGSDGSGGFSVPCPSCPDINNTANEIVTAGFSVLPLGFFQTAFFYAADLGGETTAIDACSVGPGEVATNPTGRFNIASAQDMYYWMNDLGCPSPTEYNFLILEWGVNWRYNLVNQPWQLLGGWAYFTGSAVDVTWSFNKDYTTITGFSPYSFAVSCTDLGDEDTAQALIYGPTGDRGGLLAVNPQGIYYHTHTGKVYYGLAQPTSDLAEPEDVAFKMAGVVKEPENLPIPIFAPSSFQYSSVLGGWYINACAVQGGSAGATSGTMETDGGSCLQLFFSDGTGLLDNAIDYPRRGQMNALASWQGNAGVMSCVYNRGAEAGERAILFCTGQDPGGNTKAGTASATRGMTPITVYLAEVGSGIPTLEQPDSSVTAILQNSVTTQGMNYGPSTTSQVIHYTTVRNTGLAPMLPKTTNDTIKFTTSDTTCWKITGGTCCTDSTALTAARCEGTEILYPSGLPADHPHVADNKCTIQITWAPTGNGCTVHSGTLTADYNNLTTDKTKSWPLYFSDSDPPPPPPPEEDESCVGGADIDTYIGGAQTSTLTLDDPHRAIDGAYGDSVKFYNNGPCAAFNLETSLTSSGGWETAGDGCDGMYMLRAGESCYVTAQLDGAGLSDGTYTGTLQLTADNGSASVSLSGEIASSTLVISPANSTVGPYGPSETTTIDLQVENTSEVLADLITSNITGSPGICAGGAIASSIAGGEQVTVDLTCTCPANTPLAGQVYTDTYAVSYRYGSGPSWYHDTSTGAGMDCSHCGNGNLDTGEQCDDSNTNSGDGCSSTCQYECGNNVVDDSEECDDGNKTNGDGCSSTCTSECGNSTLDGDEECDEGPANGPAPATCSVRCTFNSEY